MAALPVSGTSEGSNRLDIGVSAHLAGQSYRLSARRRRAMAGGVGGRHVAGFELAGARSLSTIPTAGGRQRSRRAGWGVGRVRAPAARHARQYSGERCDRAGPGAPPAVPAVAAGRGVWSAGLFDRQLRCAKPGLPRCGLWLVCRLRRHGAHGVAGLDRHWRTAAVARRGPLERSGYRVPDASERLHLADGGAPFVPSAVAARVAARPECTGAVRVSCRASHGHGLLVCAARRGHPHVGC